MQRVKRGIQSTEFKMRNSKCGTTTHNSELRTPNSKGFTLIEIVITIVLLSILSGLAAMIILQGVRAYSDERSRSDVHYQSRLAMERMSREIRMIRGGSEFGAPGIPVLGTITDNPSSAFSFVDMTGTQITYALAGLTLNRTAGATNVLAQGVTALSFTCFNNAGVQVAPGAASTTVWTIEIDMTDTQGSETISMRTRVHPRNF